jgi:hypothetical protein
MIPIVSKESYSQGIPVVGRRARYVKLFEGSLFNNLAVVRGIQAAAATESKVILDAHGMKAIE